jgi:hypothetical protein
MKESEKNIIMNFIQERLALSEGEAKLMAENISEIYRDLFREENPEKILGAIQKFLNDFAGDTAVLEQKFQSKRKQMNRVEKKKNQIDIFSSEEK